MKCPAMPTQTSSPVRRRASIAPVVVRTPVAIVRHAVPIIVVAPVPIVAAAPEILAPVGHPVAVGVDRGPGLVTAVQPVRRSDLEFRVRGRTACRS